MLFSGHMPTPAIHLLRMSCCLHIILLLPCVTHSSPCYNRLSQQQPQLCPIPFEPAFVHKALPAPVCVWEGQVVIHLGFSVLIKPERGQHVCVW